MAIRRDKLDIVFSNLIRERANWYCEKCCSNFRHGGGMLDCAHIMSRRHVILRWHPANALSLCRRDHMYFTEHPFEFVEWATEHVGAERIAELQRVANMTAKWPKHLREDIYRHYKRELRRLESLRAEGEMKIIDIEPHEVMYEFSEAA